MKTSLECMCGDVGKAWRRWRKRSFTMIELLVVIAIVGVLIGILLRVAVYVNQKTAKSHALRDLEQIKNALAAYYSLNGAYPPGAMTSDYEFEWTNNLPPAPPDGGLQTHGGLPLYLFATDGNPNNSRYFNPAARRWQHFVDGMAGWRPSIHFTNSTSAGIANMGWTNNAYRIWDPWEVPYNYESREPYQAFKLWSSGPNRANNNGAGDDIGVTWSE